MEISASRLSSRNVALVLAASMTMVACSSGREGANDNQLLSESMSATTIDDNTGTIEILSENTEVDQETPSAVVEIEATQTAVQDDAVTELIDTNQQSVSVEAPQPPMAPTLPAIPTGPADNYADTDQVGTILDPNNIALSTLLNHPGRIGFGSKATGGLGGIDCIVNSLDSVGPGTLRHCLENDEPLNVTFEIDGAIFTHHYILIGNNKTIDGTNSNITITGSNGILCENSSNIIIHNMKFQGLETAVRLREGCNTVWLNHLQIDDISDEGIAMVNGATDITVSWSRINKTDKGILVGGSILDTDAQNSNITLHHNVLSADQRNPNVRYAKVHMFSNLITNYKYEGSVASQLAEIRSERNAFVAGDSATNATGLRAATHNSGDTESGLIWSFEDFFASNSYPEGNVQIKSERIGFNIPYPYWAPTINNTMIETLLNRTGWLP